MTKYEVDWEASHSTIVEADSKEDAIKIARQMAGMDESYCNITDGPFVDEIEGEPRMELPDDAGEWDEEWDGKDGKTPEEKIAALVEHIKKEFPKGCRDVKACVNCPIDKSPHATLEEDVCDLLANLENRIA